MIRTITAILLLACCSASAAEPASPQASWQADWEQLRARPYPQWFTDAKLGQWLSVNGEAIYGSTNWITAVQEEEVSLERVDSELAFHWARNSPGDPIREDDFTAEWTGFIQPRYSETYTLEALADDGVRVWIDDQLILDQWSEGGDNAAAEGNVMEKTLQGRADGKIELTAGKKTPIRVSYHEKKREAHLYLGWQSNRQEKEIVPQSQLFSSQEQEVGDGLKGVYRSTNPSICYTQNKGAVYAIVLKWPGASLKLPIKNATEDLRVSLLGHEGALDCNVTKERVTVDVSNIYHNDLPCLHAWTFKLEGLPPSSSTLPGRTR